MIRRSAKIEHPKPERARRTTSMEFRPIKESDLGSTYDIRFSVTENRILPHQIHLLDRDRVLEQLRSGFGVLAIEGDAAVGYCTATGSGGPGKRSWRTAPKHCHAGPRRLRERPPSRRPHRWRHVRARAAASHARRQAPSAERRSSSETSCASASTGRRALRPILGFRRASASRPSSLAPRAAEPSADNDGPRAQTDSPRGHARLFSPTQSATRERAPAARSPRHRTRSAAPSLNAR